MGKLTEAQRELLRLCDSPLGFVADDMEASERRVAVRLSAKGLINTSGGKRAYITPEGRTALANEEG